MVFSGSVVISSFSAPSWSLSSSEALGSDAGAIDMEYKELTETKNIRSFSRSKKQILLTN